MNTSGPRDIYSLPTFIYYLQFLSSYLPTLSTVLNSYIPRTNREWDLLQDDNIIVQTRSAHGGSEEGWERLKSSVNEVQSINEMHRVVKVKCWLHLLCLFMQEREVKKGTQYPGPLVQMRSQCGMKGPTVFHEPFLYLVHWSEIKLMLLYYISMEKKKTLWFESLHISPPN